ncbi:ribonuclease Y [Patescibacteria group bacterium]|nr:ribonuclease Y [Patescibacteria group bacterium]MBU1895513.1 ribonuclease Y [Patescibacteria group bacterium]
MTTTTLITAMVIGILGLALGIVTGYFLRKQIAQAKANSIEAIAEKRLMEIKNKEKDLLLQAKEQSIKIIDDAKKEENERRNEIRTLQQRVEKRENMFDQKLMEFEERKTKLQGKVDEIKLIKERIDKAKEEVFEKLQTVAGYTKEQAMEELFCRLEEEAGEELLSKKLKLDRINSDQIDIDARELIITAMQRTASNHASETTSTSVPLPNDEMKGRIIGKDGRNIKTIEKLTGCEIIIDETPDMLLVSGFSPIRRRVCSIAINKLIKDGRIQPAKIEETIEEAKKELALDIKKAGDEALHKLGIIGIDPKLISIVGRLKYRTSYGQNVLNHSIETAYLSALIAEELGLDVALAKKAGFFHDIGKSVDQESQGTHPEIGYTILKKFGLDEEVGKAALEHHESNPSTIMARIVQVADAISASREGARRDTYEEYVARLEELENTAKDFPGVEKVYAIQAGREIRVFVTPSEIDDYQAYNLAKDIARKIEGELQYPGEIKVTLVRETRIIEYAR